MQRYVVVGLAGAIAGASLMRGLKDDVLWLGASAVWALVTAALSYGYAKHEGT